MISSNLSTPKYFIKKRPRIFAKAPPEAQRQIGDHLKNAKAEPRQILREWFPTKDWELTSLVLRMPPERPWQ